VSASAPDPEAKRRYLASGRQEGLARTLHGADFAAFLPGRPVASFVAAGKVWYVPHARDMKGVLSRFPLVVKLLDPDPERPNAERLFEMLGVLVGGKWDGDRWVSDLPREAAEDLTANELDQIITLALAGPQTGKEELPTSTPSAPSLPSTDASIPETANGT
jgi:hypothetical protein